MSPAMGPAMGIVLITGASGYVGARLAAHLTRSGRTLRLASRRPLNAAWAFGAETVTIDWDDDASLRAACAGCTQVLHLAGLADAQCAADPALALQVNAGYTARLLEAAVAARAQAFVLFSTAHVYGAALTGHVDETLLPKPRHPYGISNRAAEDFVLAAQASGRIGGLALRLSNAVGAPAHAGHDRWGLLVNDLCLAAAQDRPLVLRSPGLVERDFIALADVEAALDHLLALPAPAWGEGLFNLGSGRSMTVAAMADLVHARAVAKGLAAPLVRPEPGAGEQAQAFHFDIGRLAATGFAPRADLAAAIDETLDFCLGQAKACP